MENQSITTAQPQRYNFCPQCGQKLESQWKHCPECGTQIGQFALSQPIPWYIYVQVPAPFYTPSVTPTLPYPLTTPWQPQPFWQSPNWCTSGQLSTQGNTVDCQASN
jgi:hypothetical protein